MKNNKKGFTLVELLAVIVILAIILAIAVPSISGMITNSKKSAFEANVKMIITGISYQVLEATSNGTTAPDVDTDILDELSLYGANQADYDTAAITDMDPISVSLASKTTSKFGGWSVTGATKASVGTITAR
jgi:type IV pilus assembly protein PilA